MTTLVLWLLACGNPMPQSAPDGASSDVASEVDDAHVDRNPQPDFEVPPGAVKVVVGLGDDCDGNRTKPADSAEVAERYKDAGIRVLAHRMQPVDCPDCDVCHPLYAEVWVSAERAAEALEMAPSIGSGDAQPAPRGAKEPRGAKVSADLPIGLGQLQMEVELAAECDPIPAGRPRTSKALAQKFEDVGVPILAHRMKPIECPECRVCNGVIVQLAIDATMKDQYDVRLEELGLRAPEKAMKATRPGVIDLR